MKNLLLLLLLFSSCSGRQSSQKEQDENKDTFILEKDIYDFSSTMENNDSLIVIVDASICAWSEVDYLVFKKDNDQIHLTTTISTWSSKEKLEKLGTVEYIQSKDSLNFEDLFRYVNDKGNGRESNSSSVFTIIHHHDTLRMHSGYLDDHMDNLGYFTKIQRRLYPNAEHYQPVIIEEIE